MGTLLVILGAIAMLVGGIWLLIEAFKESVLWGLGSIFIPFVSLVFVIMHWGVSKNPFLIQIGGLVLLVIGSVLSVPAQPAG
jgi:hypothetical protein